MTGNAVNWLAAAAAGLVLAGCQTLDPMAERGKLEDINASLASSLDNWPAYQSGLAARADDLAEIAGTCADPSGVEGAELQAVCYGVSAEAYSRLTDLPSGTLAINGEPASLARGVADRAEPVCASLTGFASCTLVDTVDATVGARRMASDLLDMATETRLADPDTAVVLFDAFADEVNTRWPRATGQASMSFKRDQACYVSWAANALPVLATDGAARAAVAEAGVRAQRAAAAALAMSPCDAGEETCPRAAPCEADPSSDACIDRRVFALSRFCGPGVPTGGGES